MTQRRINATKFLDRLAFETFFEKFLIMVFGALLLLDIYINLNTKISEINNQIDFAQGEAAIFFTKPISRLIASIYTSPNTNLKIDWQKPVFRNSLYRIMVLENTQTLLPGQDYLVSIQGIRTADRLRKIPIEFVLTTSSLPDEPPSKLFTKYQEKGETYVYMEKFPDYKILVEKE